MPQQVDNYISFLVVLSFLIRIWLQNWMIAGYSQEPGIFRYIIYFCTRKFKTLDNYTWSWLIQLNITTKIKLFLDKPWDIQLSHVAEFTMPIHIFGTQFVEYCILNQALWVFSSKYNQHVLIVLLVPFLILCLKFMI